MGIRFPGTPRAPDDAQAATGVAHPIDRADAGTSRTPPCPHRATAHATGDALCAGHAPGTPVWGTRYRDHLFNAWLAVIAAVVPGCLLASVLMWGVVGVIERADALGMFGLALATTPFATAYALLPATLYGAPLYAVLSHRQQATVWACLAIALLPALALSIQTGWRIAALLANYALGVALLTHLFAQWRLRRRTTTAAGAPR